MTNIKTDILIIGAGISGLSAAYHLEKRGKRNYLLVEKEADFGGLCGSFEKDGYTFDWSGHLLHLHTSDGMKLVKSLLGENIGRLERSAWIYSHGVCTKYPFQAALYGLPKEVVTECVTGAVSARSSAKTPSNANFHDWALSLFGKGICRHFMFPYNTKLWGVPPQELGSDWCAPFVPRPSLDEIIRGAYWPSEKQYGYNPSFLYPLRGGSRALCQAMAERVSNLKLGCALEKIDLEAKTAQVKGLGKVSYRKLISTIPLKELPVLLTTPPTELRRHAAVLHARKVHVVNLGFPCKMPDKHWIYFPEKDFAFYRAGIASNFSPSVAPQGHSSLYIEIPRDSDSTDNAAFEKQALRGLAQCGLLPEKNAPKPDSSLHLDINTAYAVYDAKRAPAVQALTAYLAKHSCHCTGRYGLWRYSFMEQDLLDARDLALKLAR